MRRFLILICVIGFPVLVAARRRTTTPPGTFEYFQVSVPRGFLVGSPDGSVWTIGDTVAELRPDGTVSIIATNTGCSFAAAFFDGATVACVASIGESIAVVIVERSGNLRRIAVEGEVPLSPPAAGKNGTVVFIESTKGKIARMTRDGVITESELPSSIGPGFEMRIVIAADGVEWIVAGSRVARISGDDVRVFGDDALFEKHRPLTGFSEIVAANDGTVWLLIQSDSRTSGYVGSGALVSLTPDGIFREELAVNSPWSLVAAPDASIWFMRVARPGSLTPDDPFLMRYRPGVGADVLALPGTRWSTVSNLAVDTRERVWLTLSDSFVGSRLIIRR